MAKTTRWFRMISSVSRPVIQRLKQMAEVGACIGILIFSWMWSSLLGNTPKWSILVAGIQFFLGDESIWKLLLDTPALDSNRQKGFHWITIHETKKHFPSDSHSVWLQYLKSSLSTWCITTMYWKPSLFAGGSSQQWIWNFETIIFQVIWDFFVLHIIFHFPRHWLSLRLSCFNGHRSQLFDVIGERRNSTTKRHASMFFCRKPTNMIYILYILGKCLKMLVFSMFFQFFSGGGVVLVWWFWGKSPQICHKSSTLRVAAPRYSMIPFM